MRHAPLFIALFWGFSVTSCLALEDPNAKLFEMEVRIDQLTQRVEALEVQARGDTGPGVRKTKDLNWHFDPYLAASPFAVSQQELDRKTGQVDLLLNLVAEPPDVELWRGAQVGGPVPVEATATLSGGETLGPIRFTLHRRASLAIGSHVHVVGQLPSDDPKAVRRLAIRHVEPRQ